MGFVDDHQGLDKGNGGAAPGFVVDHIELFGGVTPVITSFEESVVAAAPEWFWQLNETSGTTAVDTMANTDLQYNIKQNFCHPDS